MSDSKSKISKPVVIGVCCAIVIGLSVLAWFSFGNKDKKATGTVEVAHQDATGAVDPTGSVETQHSEPKVEPGNEASTKKTTDLGTQQEHKKAVDTTASTGSEQGAIIKEGEPIIGDVSQKQTPVLSSVDEKRSGSRTQGQTGTQSKTTLETTEAPKVVGSATAVLRPVGNSDNPTPLKASGERKTVIARNGDEKKSDLSSTPPIKGATLGQNTPKGTGTLGTAK